MTHTDQETPEITRLTRRQGTRVRVGREASPQDPHYHRTGVIQNVTAVTSIELQDRGPLDTLYGTEAVYDVLLDGETEPTALGSGWLEIKWPRVDDRRASAV